MHIKFFIVTHEKLLNVCLYKHQAEVKIKMFQFKWKRENQQSLRHSFPWFKCDCTWVKTFQLSAAQIPMLFNLRRWGGEVPALQSISMKCVYVYGGRCVYDWNFDVTFIQKPEHRIQDCSRVTIMHSPRVVYSHICLCLCMYKCMHTYLVNLWIIY